MRIAPFLIAAALLAACGSDAERSEPGQPAAVTTPTMSADEQAVRAVAERYAEAIRESDPETICTELMSREALDKLAGINCARDILADRVRDGGPDYQLTVSAVRIVGDRALATATAEQAVGPRQADLGMVREADGWKLALTGP